MKHRDSDKPDTVGTILGLTDHEKKLAKTKVELKNMQDMLKQEEKEAWIETTKNLIETYKMAEPELDALKHLMTAGQKDSDYVDVRVIDRIKDDYLDEVQRRMIENCKDVEAKKLTAKERLEKKQVNEMNKIGVKAFQSKTTYEIGEGMLELSKIDQVNRNGGRRSSVGHVEQWI